MLQPARPDDFAAIATIWHQGWSDGHFGHVPAGLHRHRRLVDFRALVPERIQETTVATIDGRVVGFVVVRGDEVRCMSPPTLEAAVPPRPLSSTLKG